jgi:hypothetical protein
MGQFIAAGVNRGCVQRQDQWAYRIPFAVQWLWPIPIMVGVFLAPESPWWHVRRGDKAGAKAALLRLTSPDKDPSFNADETIAMIEHTNEMEKGHDGRICSRGQIFDGQKSYALPGLLKRSVGPTSWAICQYSTLNQ